MPRTACTHGMLVDQLTSGPVSETYVPVALQGRRSRHVLAGGALGSSVRQRCGWPAACADGRDPWTYCRSAPRLLALWHVPQWVLESRGGVHLGRMRIDARSSKRWPTLSGQWPRQGRTCLRASRRSVWQRVRRFRTSTRKRLPTLSGRAKTRLRSSRRSVRQLANIANNSQSWKPLLDIFVFPQHSFHTIRSSGG